MSYAATPGGGRIDIGGSVRDAYNLVVENAGLAIELAWLPFLITAGAEILALLLGGGGWFGLLLAGVVRAFGFLIFGSVFMVRWHRFVLLGERSAAELFPPGWGEFLLAAIKVGATVFVGYVVLMLIGALPPHMLTAPLAFLGGIALVFAAARLSLLFPAAAVDQPMTLRQAWDMIAGNYWRLLACLLLCWVPFGIARYVLGEIGLALPSLLWIVLQVIGLALSFAGAAVTVALLSDVYRGLAPAGASMRSLSA